MTLRDTIRGMAGQANPAFAVSVVLLPVAALGWALTVGTTQHHTYVHVMTGILWTGIDIFMGIVIGPVIGGLDEKSSSAFFQRFTPKSAFLMPSVALVTIAAGITLALRLGYFPNSEPWLALFTLVNLPGALLLIGWQFGAWTDWRWAVPFGATAVGSLVWVAMTIGEFQMTAPVIVAALAIVTILNLEGFGMILPGEVRVYLEMQSPGPPDDELLSAVGQRNAKLAGVQGFFQLILIVVMVYMRWGGF